jgi:hypothetical protein
MSKIKFIKTRLGFEAGRVVDRDRLPEGVVKTLFDFGVLEEVKEDGSVLVDQKNVEPEQPARKPRRSKKSPKA